MNTRPAQLSDPPSRARPHWTCSVACQVMGDSLPQLPSPCQVEGGKERELTEPLTWLVDFLWPGESAGLVYADLSNVILQSYKATKIYFYQMPGITVENGGTIVLLNKELSPSSLLSLGPSRKTDGKSRSNSFVFHFHLLPRSREYVLQMFVLFPVLYTVGSFRTSSTNLCS